MVITVVTVLMMQSPIHDITHMVTMWHSFMTTAFTMNVLTTYMHRMATIRVGLTDF